MEKNLNDYLDKVEKYLKPLPISERVDIVKEIKSEILELQSDGKTAEQMDGWAIPKNWQKRIWGIWLQKAILLVGIESLRFVPIIVSQVFPVWL